jgi:hypothetical protein
VKRRVVPVSRYRFGSPPEDSAYFSPPVGQIGVHHPREIVRVERDYTGGEVMQFSSVYPLELEGRVSDPFMGLRLCLGLGFNLDCQITPTQFMESINAINEILISAYSLWHSVLDNCVEIFSLQVSRVLLSTHYERVRFFRRNLLDGQDDVVSGDEAVGATCGRFESAALQPCGPERFVAEKGRVHICKLTVGLISANLC